MYVCIYVCVVRGVEGRRVWVCVYVGMGVCIRGHGYVWVGVWGCMTSVMTIYGVFYIHTSIECANASRATTGHMLSGTVSDVEERER